MAKPEETGTCTAGGGSVFLFTGMPEAPQDPSNDTQSQPLTMTLEGSLSHMAFPLSGQLYVD